MVKFSRQPKKHVYMTCHKQAKCTTILKKQVSLADTSIRIKPPQALIRHI